MKKIVQLIYAHIIAQIYEFYAGETICLTMFNTVRL